MILEARRLLTPRGTVEPGWVRLDGARIAAVGEGTPPACPERRVDLLVPGFVDGHCHGGGGTWFSDGPAAAAHAARTHLRHGTTTVVASLVSAPVAALVDQLRGLGDLVADGVLGGLHLEGPWLSPAYAGAHDPAVLVDPDAEVLDRLVAAGDGALRMVTLAPERPGALGLVRRLADAGVAVAVGHTDADADQARAAFDAGADVVTHLFNAMRSLHHRDPGPVGAALADPRVAVELVCDGVHLSPAVVGLAARAAAGGFLLVTDAIAAAGAGDGDHRLGGREVRVRDSVARLASGTLAGSTLTMDAAVRGAVRAGVPLPDALVAATRAPAERLGLDDRGSVAVGRRADLVVLDASLAVTGVLRAGAWVATGA